jgi:PqqD family protein of HPr-rel-A system
MKWQLISNQAVKLRSWDTEFVVYNSLSGDTHLIGPTAAHILIRLQQAPTDAGSLADVLSRAWQVDPSEELVLQIDEILADLHKLALIEEAA